jgi:release factor glutamine methyltransferase
MFDMIVSNPPYIADAEYAGLAREIREHEPRLALHAGPQGLDVYERLIPDAWNHLNPGGYMVVEIGYGQKDAVIDLFQTNNFTLYKSIQDYAGLDRVLVAHKAAGSK